jgi:hypothetical protein
MWQLVPKLWQLVPKLWQLVFQMWQKVDKGGPVFPLFFSRLLFSATFLANVAESG